MDAELKLGDNWTAAFYPAQVVLGKIPAFEVDKNQARALCYGQPIFPDPLPLEESVSILKVFCHEQFVGLVRRKEKSLAPFHIFKNPQEFKVE